MLRVLLIPGKSFAKRERALLERLSVGLADEGARVFQGVPGVGLDADDVRSERLGLFATPVPFADVGLPWTEGLRASVLLETLGKANALGGMGFGLTPRSIGTGGKGVQVVHVFGEEMWELAWQTARRAGGVLVVEVFSKGGVERATAAVQRWRKRSGGPPVWWNAADGLLAGALGRALGAERVASNPWGVHVPSEPHSEIDPTHTGSVVLWCGGGVNGSKDVVPLLEGVKPRAETPRGLLILANEPTADRLGLWRLADRMGLLPCLSVVPELTERWDLTLEADALLIPSADGEQHGFVLDAMAAGMPVIARSDPLAGHLVDQETAVLVREPSGPAWRAAVAEVLDQPERAVSLGSSARQHVRERRLASGWVAGVSRLYERALGEQTSAGTGGRAVGGWA